LDSGNPIATLPAVSGTAQFGFNSLGEGTHTFSAQYEGDFKNQGSTTLGSISQVITGSLPVYLFANSTQVGRTAQIMVTIQ
jgi:hypothetical protein